eukprot:7360373-Pyramimonas_sp.AAC.1
MERSDCSIVQQQKQIYNGDHTPFPVSSPLPVVARARLALRAPGAAPRPRPNGRGPWGSDSGLRP